MSHNVHTTAVAASAHIAGDGYGAILDWHRLTTDRQQFAGSEADRIYEESDGAIDQDFDPGNSVNIENSGWMINLAQNSSDFWESKTFGRSREVSAVVARKGEAEVFLLNSSQYSHVGEFRISAFAEIDDSLIEFLSDVAPHALTYLDAPGVVESWW